MQIQLYIFSSNFTSITSFYLWLIFKIISFKNSSLSSVQYWIPWESIKNLKLYESYK